MDEDKLLLRFIRKWFDPEDGVADIDETEDGRKKARELAQGDDFHEKQYQGRDQQDDAKRGGFPVVEDSFFHNSLVVSEVNLNFVDAFENFLGVGLDVGADHIEIFCIV